MSETTGELELWELRGKLREHIRALTNCFDWAFTEETDAAAGLLRACAWNAARTADLAEECRERTRLGSRCAQLDEWMERGWFPTEPIRAPHAPQLGGGEGA